MNEENYKNPYSWINTMVSVLLVLTTSLHGLRGRCNL